MNRIETMKSKMFTLVLLSTIVLLVVGCGSSGSKTENPLSPAAQGVFVQGKIVSKGDMSGVPVYLLGLESEVPPISNIRAFEQSNSATGQLYFSITDNSGTFNFENVAPGNYNLVARKDKNLSGIKRNLAIGLEASMLPTDLELLLTATGDISGQIQVPTDFANRSGVIAFLPGTSFAAFTDENGLFTISGVPVGSYSVLFTAPGLTRANLDNIVVAAGQVVTLPLVTLAKDTSSFAGLVWKGTLDDAPTNPQLNWAYYNSASKKAYIWDGSAWEVMVESIPGAVGPQGPAGADGIGIVWKGNLATAPSSPQLNWAYYNSLDGKAYIYDGSSWQMLAMDGLVGPKGPVGPQGPSGISIDWRGTLTDHPASPLLNWAYYNSSDKKAYIFDGNDWQTLVESIIGAQGPSGISIIWKGSFAIAPASPQINWAYYNTADLKSYIWDGTNWQILSQDGVSPLCDTASPIITSVSSEKLSNTSFRVNWNTNEQAVAMVEFGTSNIYGQSTIWTTIYGNTQTSPIVVAGLSPANPHYYRLWVKDASGNIASSSNMTIDITPPIISAPINNPQFLAGGQTSTSTVQSNEAGKIYFVRRGEVVNSVSDINAHVSGKKAFVAKDNAVAGTAYTVTVANDLLPGAYDMYAIDEAGNLSIVFTGWLTVPVVEITSAVVSIQPPVLGITPQSAIEVEADTGHPDFTVSGLIWNQALTVGGKFKAGQVYTATVTLTSKNYKKFQSSAFTPTVAGSDSVSSTNTIGSDTGNEVTFIVTYASTNALEVSSIDVSTQPTRMAYVEGHFLGLNGMVVTETNNDGSINVVTFTDGTAVGYNTAPSNGTSLTNATHNGGNVVVTNVSSGEVADTDNLTVLPIALIPVLKNIPAGTFQRDATPTNLSTVSAFSLSEHEITREQFLAVMGYDPSNANYSAGVTYPVQRENWYHTIAFCNKLSIAEGLVPAYSVAGVNFSTLTYSDVPNSNNTSWNAVVCDWSSSGYRLPTEMEWMWAAMGADIGNPGAVNTTGYAKPFAGSDGINLIDDYAWWGGNSSYTTHPVGEKLANELGIYDMSGSVREWCWDLYDEFYPSGPLTNYIGVGTGSRRVLRGGGFQENADRSSVAYRISDYPETSYVMNGFRVVRP